MREELLDRLLPETENETNSNKSTDYKINFIEKMKKTYFSRQFSKRSIVLALILIATGILIIYEVLPTRKIQCAKPEISNGFIVGNDYTFHGKIRFHCQEGYKMWSGNKSIEEEKSYNLACTIYGTWNGTIPTCKIINCDIPVPPSNGYIIGSNYNYGQNISFGCSTGYRMWTADGMAELKETPVLFCNKNSKWSGEIPVCKVINCETPVPPSNGYIVGSTYTYRQNITFGCSPGYKIWMDDEMAELKEAPILFCNENGEWTGKNPVCKASECESLAQGHNTRFINYAPPHHHGDIVEYECSKGYHLEKGDLRRHCRKDGSWTGSEPACRAIRCQFIERGYNAKLINYNPPHRYGDIVYYQCFEGYSIERGNVRRTCMEDGTWTGSQLECRHTKIIPVGDRTEDIHSGNRIENTRTDFTIMNKVLYVLGFFFIFYFTVLIIFCCMKIIDVLTSVRSILTLALIASGILIGIIPAKLSVLTTGKYNARQIF